jgi:uncharacterized membrane protein YkoI
MGHAHARMAIENQPGLDSGSTARSYEMKITVLALAAASLAAVTSHAASLENMPATKVSMETCLAAALKLHPGKVKELEFGIQDGDPRYEFEILTADGRETEVECSASTGKIVEVEWENEHMDLDAFLANAKVSPGEARKIALRAIPGRIVGMDLETTSTGQMSYEFEVRTADGKNMDIEVDAMTGKVPETEIEVYQLGDAFD